MLKLCIPGAVENTVAISWHGSVGSERAFAAHVSVRGQPELLVFAKKLVRPGREFKARMIDQLLHQAAALIKAAG